jgi:cytochrome c biogenesis protein CcmG/thiol:disulfide interchange protein DsbE
LVLWVSVGIAAVVAVLVAVLATSGPASQVVAQSPLVGKPAPPIAGSSLTGGGAVNLAALRGKWVLVNFSASWCVPCRDEMPQLLTFAQDHARTGNAVILTVAYDQTDLSGLRSLLLGSRAHWPSVDDGRADVTYGVGGLPESYLVDPSGTIVVKYVGGVVASQLDREINTLSFGSA